MTYYSFYPTCPNKGCHEPHKTGEFLKRDNRSICCLACGTKFNEFLNLNQANSVKKYLSNLGIEEEQLKNTRLFWEIVPNTLEKAYIDWISERPKGQFLITWPWSTVKFLPVLAIEYLLKNPNKRIAIVCHMEEMEQNGEYLSAPSANISFTQLVYINKNNINRDKKLKKNLFSFINTNLIKKEKRIEVHISNKLNNEKRTARYQGYTLTKCKNLIKKELLDESGDSICRIITRKNGKEKETVLNSEGIFEVLLEERDEWSGALNYNKYWQLELLSSFSKIHVPSREIAYCVIESSDDIAQSMINDKIIFISENVPSENLFSIIVKANADMVIFEDIDSFIKDIIYDGGQKSRDLLSFLEDTAQRMTLLMFSSKPQIRHLHEIFSKRIVDPNLITFHCWDTQSKLDILFSNYWLEESRYPNPCFSLEEQTINYGRVPETEYVQVKDLDDLFDALDPLLESISYQDINTKKMIKNYFKDFSKTVLMYAGDYSRVEVFNRKRSDIDLTLDTVLIMVKDIDKNIFEQMLNAHNRFFKRCHNKPSYLFDKLLELAKDELENADTNLDVTLVVHPFDKRGFEKLLKYSDIAEDVNTGRISISSWSNELRFKCNITKHYGKRHIIISTETPYLNYNVFDSDVEKIIFVGYKKNLEKTRYILGKRIVEKYSRPAVPLNESTKAPSLLKEIWYKSKNDEILDEEYLAEINTEYTMEFCNSISNGQERSYEDLSTPAKCLRSGEEVLVAIGEDEKCVLFPINATIHFRQNYDDISITELGIYQHRYNIKNELYDVDVFMGKDNIHRSLKVQFTKIMIESSNELPIESGLFKWNSFYDLFCDSVAWIHYLLEAREYIEKNIDTPNGADIDLAIRISESGTNAESPLYIKRWWEDYEGEVCIKSEILRIPYVEHPMNVEDMKKIYCVINDVVPNIQLSEILAIKSYRAALVLQKLRRIVLTGKSENLPQYLKRAFRLLHPMVLEMWERSDKFHVNYFDILTLNKDVPGYTIINISDIN